MSDGRSYARLVAERFRSPLERYRDATATTGSAYEAAAREAEATHEAERATIDRQLDELTSLHDGVQAMADVAVANPDVGRFGPNDATPAATDREGSPRDALRALHDSVAAHIARALPGAAPTSAGAAGESAGATAYAAVETPVATEAPYASSHSATTTEFDVDDDMERHDEPSSEPPIVRRDRVEDDEPTPRSGCNPGCGLFLLLAIVLAPFLVFGMDIGTSIVRDLPFLCSVPLIDTLDECARMIPSATPSTPQSTTTPRVTNTQGMLCSSGRTYTIRFGDNLDSIASRHRTTRERLQELNRSLIQDVNVIEVGWVICLP